MFLAAQADSQARVLAAEAAGYTFVTLPDTPGTGTDAGVTAAFLARRTTRIGLVPQLHTTVTEPFHLATQLASLDHASRARQARTDGAALVFADLTAADPHLIDRLAGVVDGVHLSATVPDTDLPALAAAIGPRPPARDTLRATLGLPRPVNQFA
ncbi:LLM class flavin-dependent oxidoreductase [Actinoplanes sp. CA-252034]|uniref:LLM class flavin-dependent oxidoreductase n=1 Tax=Actinoplanes sp. CA-252034 TaxID=3239906 RepID=UPI003D991C3D